MPPPAFVEKCTCRSRRLRNISLFPFFLLLFLLLFFAQLAQLLFSSYHNFPMQTHTHARPVNDRPKRQSAPASWARLTQWRARRARWAGLSETLHAVVAGCGRGVGRRTKRKRKGKGKGGAERDWPLLALPARRLGGVAERGEGLRVRAGARVRVRVRDRGERSCWSHDGGRARSKKSSSTRDRRGRWDRRYIQY